MLKRPHCEPSNKVTNDKSHIALSYVTHFYLDQGDASAVVDLLRKYETYSSDVLDVLQFVIVDDCSSVKYEIPDFNLNIRWLRITDDIKWNNPGARNLGVTYAPSDKVLLTDVDLEFPEQTLRAIIRRKECGRKFLRILRRTPDGQPDRSHPNVFVLSRARFLRLYGYDEEFCGNYGFDDVIFVKWQKYNGTRFGYLGSRFWWLGGKYYKSHREIDRDRSYHSLVRDFGPNEEVWARKIEEMKTYGHDAGHSRMFLNFKWEVVNEQHRPYEPARREDRLWQKLWYWRWLVGSK